MERIDYPHARLGEVVEDHHGDLVADPYRWMEASDDPEVVAWVEAERQVTSRVLSALPERDVIRSRLTGTWDYPKYGAPFERGGVWFQTRNEGLQPQAVLYAADLPTGSGRVLLDPNGLSDDGTVAVTSISVSDDGALLAYATSSSGSDWMTWRIRDVATGADLADVVEWSKFSVAAWRADKSGFFYGAVERPAPGAELRDESRSPHIRFHRLGSPQDDDAVVFAAPDEPDWFPTAAVTDDDRYLVITIERGTSSESRVLVLDLDDAGADFVALVPDFASKANVITNAATTFYLLTDREAERGRVVGLDLTRPSAEWREVVPETNDTLLEVQCCGGHLVCHYLRDAQSVLRVHELDGPALHEIPLPGVVSLVANPLGHGAVEGRAESDLLHFEIVSFLESGAIWSHDLGTGETALVRASQSPLAAADYLTDQVFVKSLDGTQIPLFLTRRRDAVADGTRPVLLYGYGGFSISLTPTFSPTFAGWLERGGMVAVANLRGGGEYGREWHEAGRLSKKQNVFDDFCSCARWLADSGWSSAQRIGISGGSNGGLLVGACLTQHPELFGAAVADVGVFDMLRFDKFTIGWAWRDDYGDPEDPAGYRWLRAYSPLHNIRKGTCYPPTMLLTGDHDDRVVPAHSFKFAATLQAAQPCDNPILLRVETDAGHGLGKPTSKILDEAADRLAFLEWALVRPP